MKLTRHARNRLRWIGRQHPGITADRLIVALPRAERTGYDDRGNRRLQVVVAGKEMTVVVDENEGFVITMWVR